MHCVAMAGYPAVVYGDKKEPLAFHVEEKLLTKMLSTGHFMNSVIMIDIDGKANRTLPKDVQFHPVSSRPIHVDFLRIGEHSQVHVNVPVRFDNEEASPGLKRGGVLNVVQHDLELICDAAEIPDEIHIDLTGLEIGDSIHISAGQAARRAPNRRSTTATSPSPPSSLRRR